MKVNSTTYTIPIKELEKLLGVKGKIVRLVGFDKTVAHTVTMTTGLPTFYDTPVEQETDNVIFEVGSD